MLRPTRNNQEQEMEKQKLLFHQARLSNRGVAEMVLLHISASKGVPSDMVMKTLELGIAILRGGNIDIQMVRTKCAHAQSYIVRSSNVFNSMLMPLGHFTGNAEPSQGKERRWIFHFHSWPHEFV